MTTNTHDSGPSRTSARRPAADRASEGGRAAGVGTSITLLILVFVGFISLGLPDGLLGVAWPSIRQTFGLPLDALGALFMTTVVGYLTASLTSAWIVRKIGVGMLLALSAFATAMSLLTFAFAPNWATIVLAGVLAGLGGGAIDAGLNSYVALTHSPRFLSWLHACFGVGAATGPAIMLAVLDAGLPWGAGYAIVGSGQALLGACFLLTSRQWQVATEDDLTPQPSPRRGEGDPGPAGWPPAAWLTIVLFLVYTGTETAAGQWAYTLFVEGRGIAAQAAGLVVSAYWGGLALGRVLSGLIANRIAPATLTRWSMAGMLVGAILIWLNLTVWLSFGGLVLMGLAAAAVFPSLIAVTPARFGADRASTIIGFQVAAASLGITGLPALSGVLAARVGLETIPLLLIVSSAGMIALHETVLRLTTRATSRTAPPT
jgi:fucose permease